MADKTVDEREMRKIRRDQIREENQQRAQEEDRRKAMAEALANLQRQRDLYLKVLRAGKEEQLPIREVESRETEVSHHDSQEKPQEQPLHELTAHSANRNEQERNTLQASERGHADRGSSTYSVTDYEQTYKTIDNVSKFRQSEMRETSASRESNSPAGIMHSTPKEDKYASLDQDILELDRMLASLKETRNKSYEKGKREPQLASSSQTEIKLISREEMDQKPYDQLEPSSCQAPVRKKLTFYEPCVESRTVDRSSQVKGIDSRQYASTQPDTNQANFRDKEEPQQSIEAREKLARLEAYQRDFEQQYNQIIYRGAESSGKSHTIETSEQLGYMRIPQMTAHLQPRNEVTQINQYVADKHIPQSYRLDQIPTSMRNKEKENVLTTEQYKQPYADGISDLRTGIKDKATVASKDTVSQKEIPSPQERVSQEMYRNTIRYDQNELGYREKKYVYRAPEYIGPNQYIKQERDLYQKEPEHYRGQMTDSVIPSRLVEVVYEIDGQKYVTLCPDNSRQYRVEKDAPMHRYASPQTLSEGEQRDSKDVAPQFHDQQIKVGYYDQFGELKLDNRTRGGEFSNRQTEALGPRKQHADPYTGSYEIRDKGESLQCFIDQEVRERRKKRENNILTLEEEIKKREIEIKAKEEWVKSQDELRKRIQIEDPIEEELKVKEHILKEKLRILNEKEIELSKRESNYRKLENHQRKEDNKSDQSIPAKIKSKAIGVEPAEQTKTIQTSSCTEQEAKNVNLTESIGTSYEGSNSCPKITYFSGEEPKPKNEATYEEWRYEVECIKKDGIYSEQIIAQAVRKSLKGPAKRVLLPLGPSVSIKDMLSRLEGVFGNVATGESILQEFYTASQKADESVTAWGLRIEEILQKAVIKGNVKDSDTNEMLKNIFWKNLRNDRLKNATRAKFESIQSFELLRRAVRAEEYDMKMNKNNVQPPQIKQEQVQENKQEETSLIKQLLSRISELEKQMKDSSEIRQPSDPSKNKDSKKTEKKDSKTYKYHSEN